MFMMIDTSTTASIAGLARATATASAMSMAIRPPQLPRLLAEIEAADGKTGGKIESCRQKIGTAQT